MIQFSKMHGLGNDFMVIDAIHQTISLNANLIRKLADRHRGIGFDQLLLVEKATQAGIDFHYRIFNADGNEVEQCGNGARCFAQFVQQQRLSDKNRLKVSTAHNILELKIIDEQCVAVNMGQAQFVSEQIPLMKADQLDYSLALDATTVHFYALSMGNPHIVLLVDDVAMAAVQTLGAKLSLHPIFPQGVNVGFMQIQDRQQIKLRVYERGVGETQACGSGACAAMVAACRAGLVDDNVQVVLPGGVLTISWQGPNGDVSMAGAAVKVFDGVVDVSDF